MDLLSKRYANPCFFMDGMIQTGRFCEFVDEFVQTVNEEEAEKKEWEFFLHKVWDGSFGEFREEIKNNRENQTMSEGTIETTIKHTQNILRNFNPEKRG